jgi:AcrR family transcriptional regulator
MEIMKASQKNDPRTRILEVADHLFYIDGIRATGTEKIMSLSSVAKATFYREFKSKEALVLAYLDIRDQSLWDYLAKPDRPKDLFEALAKFDRLANQPGIIGCPFSLVASEYRDPAHPFHRRVIDHKEKLLTYLMDLLEPFAIDRKAAATKLLLAFDGALSLRVVYGAAQEVPFLATAAAIVEGFEIPSSRHGEL